MKERPTDLRVAKTIESIKNAFADLLCETEYRKITVTRLCEHAVITKKTFYRYYNSLDELLEEFQQNMVDEYCAYIQGLTIPEDLPQIVRVFFTFNEKNKVAERLLCSDAYGAISGRMTSEVMRPYHQASDYENELMINFVNSCCSGEYRMWVRDGRPIPLDEVIAITADLVCNGAQRIKKRR